MKASLTLFCKSHVYNSPVRKLGESKPSFKSLNKSDQFVRSNDKTSISFTSNKPEQLRELRQLEHAYMDLYFDSAKTPEELFGRDGSLFASYLFEYDNPEDIAKKHASKFEDLPKIKNLLASSIDGVPVTKLFKDYKTFLLQQIQMLEKISKLESKLGLVSRTATHTERGVNTYTNFVSNATPDNNDPNFSETLRYKTLYPHVKQLVESRINKVLTPNQPGFLKDNKVKFLVVGLGKKSEEMHDYAMYAYNSIKDKNLKLDDVLDFELVDFRPGSNFLRSYLEFPRIEDYSLKKLPPEVANKLIKAPLTHTLLTYPTDILDFVYDNLRKPEKLHFGCPIEDYVDDYNGEGYDFISINNVLQYPGLGLNSNTDQINHLDPRYRFLNPLQFSTFQDNPLYNGYKSLLRAIAKMVKPGGILSCKVVGLNQERLDNQIQWAGITEQFEKIEPGLYRRKQH